MLSRLRISGAKLRKIGGHGWGELAPMFRQILGARRSAKPISGFERRERGCLIGSINGTRLVEAGRSFPSSEWAASGQEEVDAYKYALISSQA